MNVMVSMGHCLAVVSDLIFATRIRATALKSGVQCVLVSNETALQRALESATPRTVLVDMNCEGLSAGEAIRTIKGQCPSARVIAFFSHVQTDLKKQAREAKADEVLPRSEFVLRLPSILSEVDEST